ncbi:HlyD family secretion protein [Pseudomonas viridiflava]|uniref:HlyD family secretion protein n=2 Tax=Pseudomonas viridiflava TaxID=33069 RepID=A0ABU7N6V7_PSEVI|nr:HlyD family secretion protein [Pseudomonas viridiflava]MCF9021354.1 HlyD family efflux transporter periplasmic adaptor subunit [Pseudomonas syringae]MBI6575251.1 HlyD family secretion protein [Pseudomonas viridiflava]MBI6607439.1 HlyD family secretion protein [Pseudomonas viridiflava]MBI6638901.1 HlyD family secretion protein [Pseudomonas viridiflava]MBI6868879.1 HlyD family secretion protein [Pseudomonas viridiflava]
MTEPNTPNPNPDAERSAAASGETVKRTDGPAPAPLKSPVTSRPSSRRKRIISSVLFGAVALAGVLIVLYAWQLPPFTSPIQSTENAQVRGQTTLISPQLSGYVYEVPVQDFQFVKTGDLLVRLDDRIYKQRLDQALAQLDVQKASLANNLQQRRSAEATIVQRQAQLQNTIAQSRKSAADLRRNQALVTDGSVSKSELDVTRAADAQASAAVAEAKATLQIAREDLQTVIVNRGSLEASVANAEAAIQLARIDLDNTRIVAPRDGQLGQIGVRLGAYVNSGAQLMALVPERRWIIANMKETQMADVRLGQSVSFTVDALDDQTMHGRVQRISPAAGSEFSLLPADNATGNFVKISQRIPVRIIVDDNQPLLERLRPGMSVVVSIDTSTEGDVPPDPF